jgi:hypothetical protein
MNKIVNKIEVEDFFRFKEDNAPVLKQAHIGELTRNDNVVSLSFIPEVSLIKTTQKNGCPFITVRFEAFERFKSGSVNFYLKG